MSPAKDRRLKVSDRCLERLDTDRLLIAGYIVPVPGDDEENPTYYWTDLALATADEFWREFVEKSLYPEEDSPCTPSQSG